MSRNTQGGLGHRLRERRGGKRAAPTPAEQQWRRQPNWRNGAAREKEKRELGGERIQPRHSAEQQSEKDEKSRAGDNQGEKRKHRGRELSQRVWEGGARDASIYTQRAGPDDVTDGRSAAREGWGLCRRGMWEGRKGKDSLAQLGGRRAGPLGFAGAGQALASRPRAARRSPAGC